ncbi:hypothetical protein BDA99DRAFT_567346 [Phascolomyces articulosus]|uniref:Methyltransferase domain-containing protein n=1 Tax=Phascolomyces articulosus TaxID=60185 RepID=A0AAD5KRU1_9FUNG|nr:hypothetical protein BDA99DRAFT_567346 [Phascolomyces articulosus]
MTLATNSANNNSNNSSSSPTREKTRSWFFNWFSQWTTHHKSNSTKSAGTSTSRHNSYDDAEEDDQEVQRRKSSNDTNEIIILEPNDKLSIYRVETNHSSTTFDKNNDPLGSNITIQQQQQQRHISFPQHQPPHRYYNISLTTTAPTPSSERRNSQQTTASSVLSDDQFSCSSGHRRNSSDRSILRELWSKARKHHPHYPRFHWPHRRHHHHHHHHRHRLHDNESIAQSVGGTPPPPMMTTTSRHSHDGGERHSITFSTRPNSINGSGIPINAVTANSAAAYEVQNMASSYQDQHLLFSPQPSPRQRKRHSITSLVSGDRISLSSRPASIFRSQPGSPVFAALLKDGQLYDEEDDDIDLYWLDDPMLQQPHQQQQSKPIQERWGVKSELVQIALDDGLFCSPFDISPSAGVHEKHVLHVGCGDGSWATEVALEYPRWRIVGMDDRVGGPSPNRRMVPRNFKFIRCYDSSLLEGLRNMPDDSFDLVHCRFLLLSFPADQYQELVKQCWRVCKPGGFVELLEMDMRIYYDRPPVGKVTQTFNSEVIHVIESKSLDPRLARQLKDIFGNLIRPDQEEEDHYRMLYHGNYASLPLGIWGGRIGVMFREDLHELFELFQPAIAESNQTETRTELELESAFETMDAEMDLQRAFMNLHFAYAQKVERTTTTTTTIT